jgi:hypothetical protein
MTSVRRPHRQHEEYHHPAQRNRARPAKDFRTPQIRAAAESTAAVHPWLRACCLPRNAQSHEKQQSVEASEDRFTKVFRDDVTRRRDRDLEPP